MRRIYICGPYSSDPEANTNTAINAGEVARRMGLNPFVPHLFHFWNQRHTLPYEEVMALDMDWLRACAALYRLPGESPGADREVEEARRLGIPVLFSEAEVKAWAESGETHAAIDLDGIEARARAATPGPWVSRWNTDEWPSAPSDADDLGDGIFVSTADMSKPWLKRLVAGVVYYDGPHGACREEDAAHIAGMDPPTVLAMCAEMRRLQGEGECNHALITRLGDLAKRTIDALRGPPAPLSWHSTHDLPEVAERVVKERDEALATIEAFQMASGLCVPAEEKGGDPGGVKPEHVARYIAKIERDLEEARAGMANRSDIRWAMERMK